MMSKQSLSFSVATILGDKSALADNAVQQQGCDQLTQLKPSPDLKYSTEIKTHYCATSTDTTKERCCIDTRSRDDGFLEACGTNRSPICSPLQSATSPFAAQELSCSEGIV